VEEKITCSVLIIIRGNTDKKQHVLIMIATATEGKIVCRSGK
jgi:hypothetical protein